MLYRTRTPARVVYHLRAQGGPVVIERAGHGPVREASRARRAEEPRGPVPPPAAPPRVGRPCFPPDLARAMRPRPGIDTRIRDHDPARLFSDVYLLGHRSEFDLARLLAEVSGEGGSEATH